MKLLERKRSRNGKPAGQIEGIVNVIGGSEVIPGRRPFIALPHYSTGLLPQALEAYMHPTSKSERYIVKPHGTSLLALTFNRLWCACLNSREDMGWSHWLLQHSDIEPAPLYADVLIDEMDRTGCDVLATVIPIKDSRALTSTGIIDKGGNIRRLTMKQIMKLPETFDAEMAGAKEGETLAINTGLLLIDLRKPWVEDFPGFTMVDGIHKHKDGKRRAHCMPEDWHFSWWIDKYNREKGAGIKVMATRKVAVAHHGHWAYRNDSAWGDWETDLGDDHVDKVEHACG